jgi:hypothetical protein
MVQALYVKIKGALHAFGDYRVAELVILCETAYKAVGFSWVPCSRTNQRAGN